MEHAGAFADKNRRDADEACLPEGPLPQSAAITAHRHGRPQHYGAAPQPKNQSSFQPDVVHGFFFLSAMRRSSRRSSSRLTSRWASRWLSMSDRLPSKSLSSMSSAMLRETASGATADR